MPDLPREPGLDHTLALMRDPYRFIATRCARHGSDAFAVRLLMQPMICMTGPEAARIFYDPQRFVRQAAAPEPVRATLFGKGGVQGLDGEAHQHRKALFLTLLGDDEVQALVGCVERAWDRAAAAWALQGRLVLYDALHEVLTRGVCDWAGVALEKDEVPLRSRQLRYLFDRAAAKGWGHVESRRARRDAERWLTEKIEAVRAGGIRVGEDRPLHRIAWHHDALGAVLDARIAAVELLNLLRPTVAVSVYIVFAAHALHQHPGSLAIPGASEAEALGCFVQEVRRHYPFFPAVVARVKEDFVWRGYRFPRGRRVLLDLYGTNHDARCWQEPQRFCPERFARRTPGPFEFVPQGGADAARQHRCPGEGVTIELMKLAAKVLAQRLTYQVPQQDLELDMARLPALPRSGFIIASVRPRG
ncbi:MAG TPA: cytochrome P450 [Burkholderiaceae bacterium]|nr:cytochrome P450 [Burkholderiaceae bacterium]